MKRELIILTIILTVLFSCKQTTTNDVSNNLTTSLTTETEEKINEDLKTLKLDYDFIISIGQEEDFEKFKTYSFFQLARNNSIIYIDSSLTEYEFGDKLFPIVIKSGDNSFELLFEINDRPSKNYLKRLFIKDNKLVGQDKLPTFETIPKDIDNNGTFEYAGYWDYQQIWGENDNLTSYNPILYYSVTSQGLMLDSLLTKERNENIYGKFYGFSFSENDEQSVSVTKKFEQELELINHGK